MMNYMRRSSYQRLHSVWCRLLRSSTVTTQLPFMFHQPPSSSLSSSSSSLIITVFVHGRLAFRPDLYLECSGWGCNGRAGGHLPSIPPTTRKTQELNKWSQNFDERPHRRGRVFTWEKLMWHRPVESNAVGGSSRADAVIDFFCCVHRISDSQCFLWTGQRRKLPLFLGDWDPI